ALSPKPSIVNVITREIDTSLVTVGAVMARELPVPDRPNTVVHVSEGRVEIRAPGGRRPVGLSIAGGGAVSGESDHAARLGYSCLEWSGPDGLPLNGWLRLPEGYAPATRYPLIVDAGAEWRTLDTLTRAGYVVLSTNLVRSPTGGDVPA